MKMIYTVGHRSTYLRCFEQALPNRPKKLGRSSDYVGGSVWRTFREARFYCQPEYSVWGVLADWDKDTTPSTDGDWHDLLKDSQLICLELLEIEVLEPNKPGWMRVAHSGFSRSREVFLSVSGTTHGMLTNRKEGSIQLPSNVQILSDLVVGNDESSLWTEVKVLTPWNASR